MNLARVIRELNAREMQRYRRRIVLAKPRADLAIEMRHPHHGWVFICWADQRDVRGFLEGMGDEYAPLIERLDREGLEA